MSLAPGTRLGPYEVLSLLGEGGMGQVWRARDTRVDRAVALKVLPEKFFEDEERRARFGREARALASLNHPGIATLYSFEEISGRSVLAMELVEGTTLRDVLDSGPIPGKQALDFARQIARGLSAAHEKGVVHRDLKPENVLVTKDGRIKILDFGLAKQTANQSAGDGTSAPTASKYTEPGVVMGTAGYMSPEQARGLPVDKRTDVWAFGCILYEMLAGRRAFAGDTGSDTLAAILRGEADLARLPPGTSPRAVSLIRRALQKDLDQRLRDIADAQADLEEAEEGAAAKSNVPVFFTAAAVLVIVAVGGLVLFSRRRPAPPLASVAPSIAVLPFTNLSGDKEQEYFSDGLTEELMGLLTKVKELHVTGRTSSFAFKGKTDDLKSIAQKLNVATVLEGSVRRSGDRLRVSTRLVNASDGYQLWAETFDRRMTDVFAVQDEIAGAVVAALKVKLLPGEHVDRAGHHRPTPEAHEQYLLGRNRLVRGEFEDAGHSREILRKAVELDPEYAAAWAALANAEWAMADRATNTEKIEEGRRKALSFADKAIALDPELADGYTARGGFRGGLWDWAGAQGDLDRALALNPGGSMEHVLRAYLLTAYGRLPEAAAEYRRVLEIEPLLQGAWQGLAELLNESKQLAEAKRASARAIEMAPDPNQTSARFGLGVTYLLEGDAKAALAEFERVTPDLYRLIGLAVAHHALGQEKDARRALDDLIKGWSMNSAYQIAMVYGRLGERDKAFEWLERAYVQRDAGLATIAVDDFYFSSLRSDPRYAALLKKLNLPVSN